MTQDEVIKLAKKAGFGNYAYEAAGIFERFAAMVAAAEREKCTGTQEFVTLPREVVELAIEAIGDAKHKIEFDAIDALIAALKQPPTTEQSSVVQQPQANQPAMTPIAQRKLEDLVASGYTISGYSIYHERKHQHGFVTGAGLVGWWKPEGVEYPQPLGEQKLFAWISPRALEWGTRQSEKVVKLTCKAQPEYDFTEPLYTHPQPQAEQEPVGYEYVEHRPYGAPGEIRRGTILLEHYRNADGAIAGDWEWLVQQFKTSKNTISMRPLYTQPQPNPGVREAWIHGWEAAKLTNDIK